MHVHRLLMNCECLLRVIHSILKHLLVQLVVGSALRQHGCWRECWWGLDRWSGSLSLPRPTLLRGVMLALGVAIGPGVALLALLVVTSSGG